MHYRWIRIGIQRPGVKHNQAIIKATDELEISYPALAQEFRLVVTETRAGKPRMEAFRNLASRTGTDDIRALVIVRFLEKLERELAPRLGEAWKLTLCREPQDCLKKEAELLVEVGPHLRDPLRDQPIRRHDERPAYDYSYDQRPPGAEEGGDGGVTRGTRVRHPIFGPGVVLEVSGSGRDQALRIRFDRAGIKKIVVRYANLELG